MESITKMQIHICEKGDVTLFISYNKQKEVVAVNYHCGADCPKHIDYNFAKENNEQLLKLFLHYRGQTKNVSKSDKKLLKKAVRIMQIITLL